MRDLSVKIVFFLLSTAYCLLPAVAYASAEPPRYEITANFDSVNHTIKARQKVTFTNNSSSGVDALYFHIYPNRRYTPSEKRFLLSYSAYFKANPYPGGFQSGSFKINSVSQNNHILKYEIEGADKTLLKVELPGALSSGESVVIELDFEVGIPHAYGRFGWHRNITSLIRWYPMLSVLDKEGWHNYPFYPYHQPYFSAASYYDLHLTLDSREVVVHSGDLKSENVNTDGTKDIFISSGGPLRDFGMVISPDFKMVSRNEGAVKINSYYLAGDEFYADRAAEFSADLIRGHTQKFSSYPYQEFNIAPSYLAYGGTQSSGLILIDTRVYRLPKFLIRYFDFMISHETGHQWFYNLTGSDENKEMFIDEGFNSYFTLKHLQEKYGKDGELMVLPWWLKPFVPNFSFQRAQTDRYSFTAKNGLDRPVLGELSNFQEPSSIFSITYGKGSKIVDMLRYILGEEHFKGFMERYFRDFKFENISVADLEKIASEEAGKDLGWFFEDWLRTSKQCDYAVKLDSKKEVVVENKGSLNMPLEVKKVPGTKRHIGARHQEISLDPNNKILDLDRVNNNYPRKFFARFAPIYYPVYEIPVFLKEDAYNLIYGPQIDGSGVGVRLSLSRPQDNILYLSNTYNFGEERFKNVLGFRQLHLGGKMISAGVEGFNYRESSGKNNEEGFKLSLRKELWPVGYGLTDENDHISLYLLRNRDFKSTLASGGAEDIKQLYYRRSDEAIWGLSFKMGRYGTYPDSLEGWKLKAVLENAEHFLGGKEYFWRFSPELARYFPLAAGQSFAAKFKLGLGYPADKGLFQLGGEYGLRGYGYKTINGANAVMLNLEYRRDLLDNLDMRFFDNIICLEKIQGAGFLDIGRAWFRSFQDRPFRKDAGLGLRFHFAIGSFLEKFILRLDAAQPLNQPKASRHYWAGLSHAF